MSGAGETMTATRKTWLAIVGLYIAVMVVIALFPDVRLP